MSGRLRQLRDEWRPSAITLGAPVFPLAVLFGLNAVDELDRSAFAVLLPDIRDHFGLSDAAALALVAATTIAVLLVEIPLSFAADRRSRVRMATSRCRGVGVVQLRHRARHRHRHARRDARRGRSGQGRRHAHPLLAARRLLPAGGAGQGVLRPSSRQLHRPDHRAPARRIAGDVARMASAVPAVRDPFRRAGAARGPATRTGARLPRAPRRRRRRRCGAHRATRRLGSSRGSRAEPDPNDPPDLVRRTLPGDRPVRHSHALVARLRRRVRAQRRTARLDRHRDRTAPDRGRRGRHARHVATRRSRCRLTREVRRGRRRHRRRARRGARLRTRMSRWPSASTPCSPPASAPWRPPFLHWSHSSPRRTCGRRRSPRSPSRRCQASPCSCRSSEPSRTRSGYRRACSLLVPTCVIGALILASAAKIVDDDIADVRRGSLAPPNSPSPLSEGVATVV